MHFLLSWWLAPGRRIALLVFAILLIPFVFQVLPLRMLRDRGFDLEQRLYPLPAGNIFLKIVAIDEESLKQFGQWPWPRALVARLVQRIADGQPAALGIDIIFPEADGYSPPRLAGLPGLPASLSQGLKELPSSDDELAQALAKVPTVLGAAPAGSETPEASGSSGSLVRQIGGDSLPYITNYPSTIRSLPEIARAAHGEGALTVQPDEDGIVRTIETLVAVQGQLVPAFGLEIIRAAAGLPPLAVTVGGFGIDHAALGPLVVPTDGQGRAYLHFGEEREHQTYSAARVLGPGFNPAKEFHDQIVLLGVTGLGLVDQKFTPFGLRDGITFHAQMIESVLGDTLLHRPGYVFWIELGVVLFAGFAVIALARFDTPWLAGGVVFGIIAGVLIGEFAIFRFAGWLIDGIYPAIAAFLTAGAMLVGHLLAVQAARRLLAAQLQRAREQQARTDGELAAARDLQLGLLPLRFPAFPTRPDIDLFARIEPARSVGGDFFDFRLIDADHLFLLIADVAGKGIPAALFMELTLQIVRSAVQRHECDLDQIFGESNTRTAEVAADLGRAGDGMFVTVFAGIVDTKTGDIVYASAGHDPPFVVHESGGLRQLKVQGGPPFGVLDFFPYTMNRDRLPPGAVLLMFTDGLTEAQDGAGDFYTLRRAFEVLGGTGADDAKAVVDFCFDSVGGFVGDAEQADDITMLAVRLVPDDAVSGESAAGATAT